MQNAAKSKEYQYIVVCGDVVSCQMHPEHQAPRQPMRLHSKLDGIVVQLLDDQGNMYGGSGTRLPDITYECPQLDVGPVVGQSACWEANAHAQHQLKLPQLVMKPRTRTEGAAGLVFAQPDKPVRCMITVQISKLPTSQGTAGNVSVTFLVKILPGSELVFCCLGLVILRRHPLQLHMCLQHPCLCLNVELMIIPEIMLKLS